MIRATAKIIKICFYATVVLVGVTFAISNRGTISLQFYPVPYETTMPLFLFTVLIFIAGLFVGWSIARMKTGTHKRAHKQAKKRVAALENELGILRTERLATPAMALPRK
jgi:uncharacterized integral membrane protein